MDFKAIRFFLALWIQCSQETCFFLYLYAVSYTHLDVYKRQGLKFNDKLAKVKEVSGYLAKNDKLRELSEKKIKQLLPEQDLAEVLLQLK